MDARNQLRQRFPALDSETVFLDNAGGSQLPDAVIDRMAEYLCASYVQLGADYKLSRRATRTVERARELLAVLMGAGERGPVVMGPSTSALCAMLADAYARARDPGRDEIVVCEAGHEANVGPWVHLAERGFRVRWWRIGSSGRGCPPDGLAEVLSERTRVVALPHVSNLLGGIEDLERATRMAHEVGARVVADGVAFAPHRAMDVARWGVDWYVFSAYKVYGPHMAALYGAAEAFDELEGPNHFFVDPRDVPYKFELGGVNHEGCAGLLGMWDYLAELADRPGAEDFERDVVARAFGRMESLELPLQARLIEYLRTKPRVRLIGPDETGPTRVPTVSFVHEGRSSREIALAANERQLGIRYGHFYAHRLCTALGLEPEDGVVRASLLHYNSEEEVERLIECLDPLLG